MYVEYKWFPVYPSNESLHVGPLFGDNVNRISCNEQVLKSNLQTKTRLRMMFNGSKSTSEHVPDFSL